LNLVAIALDEAAGNDELLRAARGLVLRHFEDGIDGLLLGGINEGAGVDDQNVGGRGILRHDAARAIEQAHHDFTVDQVFRAAERDEADAGPRGISGSRDAVRGNKRFHPFILPF